MEFGCEGEQCIMTSKFTCFEILYTKRVKWWEIKLSMAHPLSNICTKNYWNRTTIVRIIVGGWVGDFQVINVAFGVITRYRLRVPRVLFKKNHCQNNI